MPCSLAKTELAVRPCIAFLHADISDAGPAERTVGEALIPRPDASEVAAVFSAPFHNFLKTADEVAEGVATPGHVSDWYAGSWTEWNSGRWRMHNFYVPINNQRVTKPKTQDTEQTATVKKLDEEEEEEGLTRYRVWGMTARILLDAARLAYDEKPDFEHNEHMGDEKMIENLFAMGRLTGVKKAGSTLTKEDLSSAAKM